MQKRAEHAAMLRAMNAPRRILLVATAVLVALALMAAPVLAVPALADSAPATSAVLAVEEEVLGQRANASGHE
jgi:hypothetical protein